MIGDKIIGAITRESIEKRLLLVRQLQAETNFKEVL